MPNVPNIPVTGGKVDVAAMIAAAKGNPPASTPTVPDVSLTLDADTTAVPVNPQAPPRAEPPKLVTADDVAAKGARPNVVVDFTKPKTAASTIVPAAPPAPPPPPPPTEFTVGPHGLPVFEVELKDNPPYLMEAEDRLGAIDAYRKYCGIIKTEHPFSVRRV